MKSKIAAFIVILIVAFIFWLFFLSPTEKVKKNKITLETPEQLKQLVKQPEKYKGYAVKLKGIVVGQPELDADGYHFQLFLPLGKQELNFIIDYAGSSTVIVPDSSLFIAGEVKGGFFAETVANELVRLVHIKAEEIRTTPKLEVLAPTLKRKKLNLSQKDKHLQLTLEKVEFAHSETRFYLAVTNKSSSPIIFKPYDFLVIAGKKQTAAKTDLPADYAQLPVELLPGQKGKGVVVFSPLPADKTIKLVVRYIQAERDKNTVFTLPSD